MAGKAKYAEKLAKHLDAPIDGACAINKPGSTATMAVGGVLGMAASAAATRRAGADEIKVVSNGWLAVGPRSFALVRGDKLMGNPKGEPFADIAYTDVAGVDIKQGRITVRASVSLLDGRSFAFETKSKGANKGNPEVLELLAERCR
ncbi:MAG: hypothetical protein JWN32_2461 [Solirubrobacterales bacterium]|nr:hypothetical protein [Solirubrobacterales bacterium]